MTTKVEYPLITCLCASKFTLLMIYRAFLKFDGHLIKNGVKICASSVQHLFKHQFGPEHIMLPPKGYDVKLEGLPLDDFRNFMEYLY